MIRSVIAVLMMTAVLGSCNKKDEIPADVMKPDKMQAVMWDVLRANAFVNEYIRRDSSKNIANEQAKLQLQIFGIHKISKTDFEKSYTYYQDHPARMTVMLDTLIARANRSKTTKIIQGRGDN